jgi:hypothetical protein
MQMADPSETRTSLVYGVEVPGRHQDYVQHLDDQPTANCLYVATGQAINHFTGEMPISPNDFNRRMPFALAIANLGSKFIRPDGKVDDWSVARDVLQSTLAEFSIFPKRYYSERESLLWDLSNVSHVRAKIVAPVELLPDTNTLSFDQPALVYSSYKDNGHVDFVPGSNRLARIIRGNPYMAELKERATIREVHLLEAK